jgi:hypothetical protein
LLAVIAVILSPSQQLSRTSMHRKASRTSLLDAPTAERQKKRLSELQAGETGRCMRPPVLLAGSPHRFLLSRAAKGLFIAGLATALKNSVKAA